MSQESVLSNASTDILTYLLRSNEENLNALHACINNPGLAQRELLILSRCFCCNRHQINKPRTFTPWREREVGDQQNSIDHACGCNCRHISRFICRQHSEYQG